MNEIPLIVPTLNKFELFIGMMETVDYPIIPYVINNAKHGYSVAKSWNHGIKSAISDGYEYALIVNDDIEFLPGTIEKLAHGIKQQDAIIISPNSILVGRDLDFFYPRSGYINGSEYACFIANIKSLVQSAGWFDENFFPAYFEDNDMKRRISLSKGIELIDTEVGVRHFGSATGAEVVDSEIWNRLKEYYISKWGGLPGHEIWNCPYNDDSKTIKDWHNISYE